MDTENFEISPLSDGELDAVSGGVVHNNETMAYAIFLMAVVSKCGPAAYTMLANTL